MPRRVEAFGVHPHDGVLHFTPQPCHPLEDLHLGFLSVYGPLRVLWVGIKGVVFLNVDGLLVAYILDVDCKSALVVT